MKVRKRGRKKDEASAKQKEIVRNSKNLYKLATSS